MVFKKFILQNLTLTLILSLIGIVLFLKVIPEFYRPYMISIPIFGFLINLLNYKVALAGKTGEINLLGLVTKSFVLKFFSYLGLVILFVLIEKAYSWRVILIVHVFVVYIAFTILEVKAFSEYARKSG